MFARKNLFHAFLIFGFPLMAGSGCLGEAEPYFSDSTLAPQIDSVTTEEAGSGERAAESGLAGGVEVHITGQNFNDENLSVRIGDRAATVVADSIDVTGQFISVLSPPGPISGGIADVGVSTSHGVATLPGAYEYRVPDDDFFRAEAGSLEIIGTDVTGYRIALAFWPTLRPRLAGSLFDEGALYYLPGLSGVPVLWDGVSPNVLRPDDGTVHVVDLLNLEPVEAPNLSPITLVRDAQTGQYELCQLVNGPDPWWTAGAEYEMKLSGGALSEPVTATLHAPPAPAGEPPSGLLLNDVGVAMVDLDRDLMFSVSPLDDTPGETNYLLVELVVEEVGRFPPQSPYELSRLVLQVEKNAAEVTLSTSDLALLQNVDTTCAMLGQQLEAARLSGDSEAEDDLLTSYDLNGCLEPDVPLTQYAYQGYIRLSRHAIYRVPLGAGLAGCSSPGSCGGDTDLVVDLVAAYEVPASFLSLTDCEDLVDNDGDGLVDAADPGCANSDDNSEIDQSGAFPCDNGIDDDGDGTTDYVPGDGGDPGCVDALDSSELSVEYLCDDGKDNDGDGLVDYRPGSESYDPGCTSLRDNSETEQGLACDDGQDNDGDGRADFRLGGNGDPGCSSVNDTNEFGTLVCDDGIDNDLDGYIDYRIVQGTGDPGCADLFDGDEKYLPPADSSENLYPCDDGLDNDGDGLIDTEDAGCREVPVKTDTHSPYEADELNQSAECDDGEDNDGDGYIDYRADGTGDPECLTAVDGLERT